MERHHMALALRAFALVGLISLNGALPVDADDTCQSCLQVGSELYCFELTSGNGHTYCEPHGDHCDMAGACTVY
jgi:hypothetical protein